jgi:16S rRNA (guanine1516-N2)-methyltransferase
MFITTAQQPNSTISLNAKKLAQELSCSYIHRGTSTLSQLKKKLGDDEILLVGNEGLKFVNKENPTLFFHPNLSHIRITSLLKGKKDRLIAVSNIREGDTVLDCTMGLATDSIVLSFALGNSGKIITIESETILYILAEEGLKNYVSSVREINEAMRRVTTIHADHLEYMRSLPDKSFDVVYFDPMFRRPAKTIALTPLRSIANMSAITKEAIIEAKRIARKKIVMKENKNSEEFERLGFRLQNHTADSKVDYGVIECDG